MPPTFYKRHMENMVFAFDITRQKTALFCLDNAIRFSYMSPHPHRSDSVGPPVTDSCPLCNNQALEGCSSNNSHHIDMMC